MKNLHERLTKNLGKRLLMGVFFIFLGMAPAIYIWSCVPNNKPFPIPPIPPTPTPMSVSNIEFNTNNDYLYDYSPPSRGTKNFKNNQYISLKDNQYIYYDNENKIDFINSDSKIIPIENQKIIKAIGEFNSKDVIILNNNDIFKIGLINNNSIEYINISKLELDFSKPIFISQSSETTFNLIYTDKNNFISLLQFDTLTNVFYNHSILYQGKKIVSYDDIYHYQNGIIFILVLWERQDGNQKIYSVSNNQIINDNNDINLTDKDLYIIPAVNALYNLNSHVYDYKNIDRNKIKIATHDEINMSRLNVWDKNNQLIYNSQVGGGESLSSITEYTVNYSVVINVSATSNSTKVFYMGDMLTDNYNYLIYDGSNSYISVSENNLYIIDYTNGYLNIKYYDIFSKKIINKEFKNIKDIKLEKKYINFNNFYIYQGNYYFNIYENNTLKVFTNENNIANINIDKYKITRYKNNLVILTVDKCLLLNLDSKNTTEFNLKDFDFDNYNSEFINANFDKNNILFKNNNSIHLFVFKL